MNKYQHQNKIQSCLVSIKNHLKSQNITYRELSERLGVSEITIKRQINSSDISMSRLLALCEASEVDFEEIWNSLESQKPKHTIFSSEQDDAFYRNPNLMSFFFELYLNKKAPEEVRVENHLSEASLHLYLRKLEDIGLIRLSEGNRVGFNVKAPLGFSSESKVKQRELSQVFKALDKKLSDKEPFDRFLISKPLQLSEDLKLKLFEELLEVISRYAELSEKYFSISSYEVFELVACESVQVERIRASTISNIRGFK